MRPSAIKRYVGRVTATPPDLESFVAAFAQGWALDRGPEAFIEFFEARWIDPEVVLRQPLLPTETGHDGFRRFARQAFALLPDLHIEVTEWHPHADGVSISLAYTATLGTTPISTSGTDVIRLRNNRIVRRDATLRLAPLFRAAARDRTAALHLAKWLLNIGRGHVRVARQWAARG